MKAREALFLFALIGALSLALSSSPKLERSVTLDATGPHDRITARVALPVLGLLQDQPPAAQPAPDKPDKEVDVTVKTEKHEWYVSPVWLAIGILGAVVLVLLVGMALRGSGTRETTRIVHE